MKILMILTSHAQLGDTGEKTGFWLEEFAAPEAQTDATRRARRHAQARRCRRQPV
jgi:hypothetical protein